MGVLKFENEKDFGLRNNKARDRVYSQFSTEQKALFHSIQDNIFTFCEANAGTGKTLTTIASLIDLLANGEINKIIYIQKVSQRYLQHGYLPGTLEEKTESLWDPFYDAMMCLGYMPESVERMLLNELIILTTDSKLRGVNFEKAGVCVDEAENCDTETLKLIFTRCHDNCHVVMLGDSKQKDNRGNNTDFIAYGDYLADACFGNKCELTKNYRGKFSNYAENFGV